MAVKEVKNYYDNNSEKEWERLQNHNIEFVFTTYMMDKYISQGDSILDIGGGPGRYSIYYAQKGCDVTLFDLSDSNIELAKIKAAENNVIIKTYVGNCLDVSSVVKEKFDHVFLMGPLYHLQEEEDRIKAVQAALDRLKPGGKLYCSFVLDFAGLIYDLKNGPGYLVEDLKNEETKGIIDCILQGKKYKGTTFTSVCYVNQKHIEPFMNQFNLKKLHLFGQEGILAPNENQLKTFPKEEYDLWIETAKRFLDVPEYLSYSEHVMYIGEKQ